MRPLLLLIAIAMLVPAPAAAGTKTAVRYVMIGAIVPATCDPLKNGKATPAGVQFDIRCNAGTAARITDNAGHTLAYTGTGLWQSVTLRGATNASALTVEY